MSVLVSQKAPDFITSVVLPDGQLDNEYRLSKIIGQKYVLLFFYPLDFTFVCPSELVALNKRITEFKERNIEVIGVSIDSQYTHLAWRNTPLEKGGIGPVEFSLAADINHAICKAYGVEHPVAGVALRAAFLIDKQGAVRAQLVNDLPLGRSVDEILRLFDALQFHEKHGEVCPADWNKGRKGMKPTHEGVSEYLAEQA